MHGVVEWFVIVFQHVFHRCSHDIDANIPEYFSMSRRKMHRYHTPVDERMVHGRNVKRDDVMPYAISVISAGESQTASKTRLTQSVLLERFRKFLSARHLESAD